MANKYRERCESNLYHVTARGVGKQVIFEDDVDRRFFGKRMRTYLNECDVELYAWCLMSNHVHLLLRADLSLITKFMQKLLTSYAKHYNKRHERTGHLFQNRFDSVPVSTDEQLKAVTRYIHRNPDGIPGQDYRYYEWSSYREYVGRSFITNVEFVLEVFDNIDCFIAFHESNENKNDYGSKDTSPRKRIHDDVAISYAKSLLGMESIASVASLDKASRNRCLATLKEGGLPIEQIARITGIGRNIVQRAK